MPRVAQSTIDQRRREITHLLRQRAYLPVAELCRRFNISEATARRDLAALSHGKTIVRTFGGAMADFDRRFAPFADRLRVAAVEKQRIATEAVRRIAPDMTVFIDAGTTLYAVAGLLSRRSMPLRVVTNSLAVAERLAVSKSIEVDLLGGRLLMNQSVLLGNQTCKAAGFYRFDLALLGAEGFDARGVWNSTEAVVALQQAVVQQSAHHAICADSSKMGRAGATFLMPWNAVDLLITDADVTSESQIAPRQVLQA